MSTTSEDSPSDSSSERERPATPLATPTQTPPAGRIARSAMFRSLRYRNARLFFTGLAISNVGTWLQLTAMSLLVYRITGEATAVGITVALQFLPMLLLGAWAGAVADGVDRRKMAILTQSGLAAQALLLGVLDLSGVVNLGIVYVLSLVLGVVNAFDNPARRALVTELVDAPDIPNATSLNTAVMTGSRIFGPALAAALVSLVGTGWCFMFNGITFSAIIVSLVMIRPAEMFRMPRRPKGGKPVREALGWISGRNDMVVVFVTLVIISTFAFNQQVVLPKLADRKWGSDDAFGFVLAVMSVGSLIGSLLTARFQRVTHRWMMNSAVVLALSGFGLAWAPNLWVAFAWAVPMGIGGAGFIAGANAITQQEAPSDMRSRLMALQAVAFLGSTPIGGPITGVIADTVSAEWALAYGSVITLATVGWAIWFSRRRVVGHAGAMHATRDQLDDHIDTIQAAPSSNGTLELVVSRPEVGERDVLDVGELRPGVGLVGDNYVTRGSRETDDGSAHPEAELNIMSARSLAAVSDDRTRWPLAGDQLIVDIDLSTENLPAGTRLQVGGAVIEVTAKPHNGCAKFAQRFGQDAARWVNSRKDLRLRGINAIVVEAGEVRPGDTITKL
ncbi:MAG: MFS transporter [Ilumatobacteraceae bacterium]|nr:MFS transporter [Ilumatobacteraceae bacterium]